MLYDNPKQMIGALCKELEIEKYMEEFLMYDIFQDNECKFTSAWFMILDVLEQHRELNDVFVKMFPYKSVLRYCLQYLSMFDAADIAQETMLYVYMNIDAYKPWLASMTTYAIGIAIRKKNDFLRSVYKDNLVSIDSLDIDFVSNREQEQSIGWSIPVVAQNWIIGGGSRAKFANMIMMSYLNIEWIPPTGQEMQSFCGISKTTCHNWFKEFMKEVMKYEMQG